ncbi:MAG: Helix-turn-helix domain [Blastocatellia bacterium]|jgi:DNA-binding XRE family transcriptional regulator|nr:Helix-turn-helix domain [Blastocatellia bacterium]
MTHARTKRAQRHSSKAARSLVRTRPNSKDKTRKRPYPLKLADKLRRLRENLDLSQGDLAARISVKDRASISGYERGEREPPLPILLAYARLGKVRVEVLIDDELDLPK